MNWTCPTCNISSPAAYPYDDRPDCYECLKAAERQKNNSKFRSIMNWLWNYDRTESSKLYAAKELNEALRVRVWVMEEMIRTWPEHISAMKDAFEMPDLWWLDREELSMEQWIQVFHNFDYEGYWRRFNQELRGPNTRKFK